MMTLNKIPLDERTEKALRLCAERDDLHHRIKAFVGEANLGYEEGFQELRNIASKGILAATKQHLANEQTKAPFGD